MKEQTAMQELIEWVNDNQSNWESETDCKSILSQATQLLTKEREQHTKTYTAGFYAGCDQPMMDNMPVEYFSTTYKQPL